MNRAVNKPRKNFTVRYATNTLQGFRVDKVPTKTTSCSLFRSQRLNEELEENMCHTDLYAYIKVFGSENQREQLVNLKSKVRRTHLLQLYRQVRGRGGGNNPGGNNPGGGGGGNPGGGEFPGGGGNRGNNPGGGGGEFPGGGGSENKFTPENDYFTSDNFSLSRGAYELSKLSNPDEGFLEAVQRWNLNKLEEKKLKFRLGRLLVYKEYDESYYESYFGPVFSDPPVYSVSYVRSFLQDIFKKETPP
jgi:hypothetical protein